MKKAIVTTVIILSAWALIYLLASFAVWNLNPGAWEHGERVLITFFFAVVLVIIVGMRYKADEYFQ